MRNLLEILKLLTGFSSYTLWGIAGLLGGALCFLFSEAILAYQIYKENEKKNLHAQGKLPVPQHCIQYSTTQ